MRKVSRYNRSVATYRLSAVVLLSTIQGLGGAVLAQNQGIGGVSQPFAGNPGQAEDYPQYRIEVLAFAYNRFDPGEEVFPDEPFQIRLDTRPPKFLILPTPAASDISAPAVLPDPDQVESRGESGDPLTTDETPVPASTIQAPAAVMAEAGPEAEMASDGAPAIDDLGDSGALGDADDLGEAGGPEDEAAAEPDPFSHLLGPADDTSLDSLPGAAMATESSELPAGGQNLIRSAYVQRLIASLQFLEDPSRVPIIFDPIPENVPLSGLDGLDSNPVGGDAVDPDAVSSEEPGLSLETPRSTFRVLRADELELRGALQRLGRDAEYTPLAHGGWILPAYPPDLAVPIDISLLGTVNPVGTVKLHLSRFLHVTVDLVYRAPPVPEYLQAATVDNERLSELELPPRYALRTQRRVRSGEVHYLDHPAIGILVVVRPQPVDPGDVDDPLSPPRGPAA